MDAQLRKLADLEIDQSYHVLGYRPINTKFGDTYIITCRFYSNDIQPEFDMFATKVITSYISNYLPKEKFFFTVRRNATKGYTYTEIDGYKPTSSFIRLN